MNKYEQAKDILGADLNQSLHNLIGYWYTTRTDEVFDTELACHMIDICLKEMFNPLDSQLRTMLHEAIEVIELAATVEEVEEGFWKARQFLKKHEEMIKALVTKKCYDNEKTVTKE